MDAQGAATYSFIFAGLLGLRYGMPLLMHGLNEIETVCRRDGERVWIIGCALIAGVVVVNQLWRLL